MDDQVVTGKSGAPAKSAAQRMREYRDRHRDRVRAMDRARDRSGRYDSNPEQKRAWNIVAYMVRCGKLLRQPCEICKVEPAQAHHDDYSKPLDIRWLCREHHEEHHQQLRLLAVPGSVALSRTDSEVLLGIGRLAHPCVRRTFRWLA